MEENNIQDIESSQEIEIEEGDGFDDGDFEDNQSDSDPRHLFLWIMIIVAVVLILIAWIYFTKMSFERIDDRFKIESSITKEQATEEVKDTFREFGQMLESADSQIGSLIQENQKKQQEAEVLQKVKDNMADEINNNKLEDPEPSLPTQSAPIN